MILYMHTHTQTHSGDTEERRKRRKARIWDAGPKAFDKSFIYSPVCLFWAYGDDYGLRKTLEAYGRRLASSARNKRNILSQIHLKLFKEIFII